jgi:hypothetical protein
MLFGLAVGTALGALARLWMRLLADDPAFTWSGSAFIVGAFAVAGLGQGAATAARRTGRRRRWTTPVRGIAAVLALPMFSGAGMLMLPTVVGGSLASWRRDWPRAARLAAGLVAAPVPIVMAVDQARMGLEPAPIGGLALLAATYALIVWGAGAVFAPLDDGWRMPRAARACVAVAMTGVLLAAAALAVGLPAAGG